MMGNMERLQICFSSDEKVRENNDYNLDRIIFDLDSQVELLSSQTDNFDYLISIASVEWRFRFGSGKGLCK